MRRIVSVAAAAALGAGGCLVSAEPASAAPVHLTKGWSIWTKEYCQDGKLINWKRLHGPYNTTQGRQYVYKRDGRLCAFVVDRLPGSRWMSIHGWQGGYLRASDSWLYTTYAGAIAAPKGQCAAFNSSLIVMHGTNGWSYSTHRKQFC